MAEDSDTAELNKSINEEYKTWKKNTPYLYDLVISHALDWPSLTVQWLPDEESPPGKDYKIHRLLLGTHTSGAEQNYLRIASVHLPVYDDSQDIIKPDTYNDDRGEFGTHSDHKPRVNITQSIPHEGEVNRARYMPQNPDLLATRTVTGDVFIFDRTRHPLVPKENEKCSPDIILKGQTKEGYGLAWNPTNEGKGHVLGASEDTTVVEWDIQGYSKENSVLNPLRTYNAHENFVEDVSWHATRSTVFASVGDDRMLYLWDSREGTKPVSSTEAHLAEVNSVAFSPSHDSILLTGSADKTIGLWDTRKLSMKLHSLEGHEDEVLQLAWSPHEETVLASASGDRRVCLWDISRIGQEQSPEDAEDGPPELMFIHGGHTNKPVDLSWCPLESQQWHLASVAEDNVLQVWSPSKNIYMAEDAPIRLDDLE